VLDGQLTTLTEPTVPLQESTPPDDGAAPRPLPDKPLFTLRPRRGWVRLNVRELWAYRELLFFLTLRDIQVRYKQTLLGAAWAIIQPLATMLLFWLFFGKLAGMPSDGIDYPLFAFAGLLPWTFFANALTTSGNSLVGSSNLVTKVYFPRMIIPGAAVLAGLVDFAIAFVVLGGLLLIYACYGLLGYDGPPFHWQVLLLPYLILLLALLATGVGMGLSALNVQYRDVRYALPFLIQLWMFATPIIYPTSIVPLRWRWVLALNPLTGIVEGFRSTLFARPIDWSALALSTAVTVGVFLFAAYYFRRMEARFADVV
jgi:lipopolysaccharide transport system permease protein